MPPQPKTLSDDQLDDLLDDEDFGAGVNLDDDDGGYGQDDDDNLDPEAPPEPEAGTDPEPEPEGDEPEAVSLKSLGQKYGFEFPDEADEVETLESFLGQVAQLRDRYSQERQQFQTHQQQIQQYQQQLAQLQGQQKPAEPTDKPPEFKGALKHWEKVPEWSDDWLRLVKRDEEGNLVPISGADPSLPQKIMDRQRWEERAQRLFFENPRQFIHEALEAQPDFQSGLQEQVNTAVSQLQDRMEAQRIADQMAPFLKNEDGTLTEAGQAYVATIQMAEQGGIRDSQTQHQFGLQAALPYIQQMRQAQSQTAEPEPEPEKPAQAKKRRQLQFAKQAAETRRNRGHRDTGGRKFRNPEVDIEKYAAALMEKEGIDPHAKYTGR